MARTPNIGLPSNLYSGEAVVLNSAPYTNYYLNTIQRRQAQDDALSKYFTDLDKNVTPKGMHTNDIETLMQQRNAWQQFAMQNKRAIQRPGLDGGRAYQKYMGMYNSMLSDAEKSRFKVKNLNEVNSIFKDPTKRQLLTEQTLADIQRAELPINDPDYNPIDLNSIAYNHKPFDINDQGKLTALLNRFRGSKVYEGAAQPISGSNREKVKFRYDFSPDQLQGIYNIGSQLYHSNPGFKENIDQHADPLSNDYEPLNSLFKKHFGKDISTPEDMAAAYTLSLHPNKEGGEETRTKTYNPFDLIAARGDQTRQNIDYRQQAKDKLSQEQGDVVNDFWDREVANAKNNPIEYKTKEGKVSTQYQLPATSETKKLFSYKNDKGHSIGADDVRLSPDGNEVQFLFYQRDDDGHIKKGSDGKVAVDTEHSGRATIDEVKLRIGKQLFGVKANTRAMSGSPKPKNDPLGIF